MLDDTLSLPVDERYTLVALTPEDGPEVQALMERRADHAELVMGLPPGPAEAQSLYMGLPEGKGYEDKLLLGVFTTQRRLVGVLDALRDYPKPGEWWIGLLLLGLVAVMAWGTVDPPPSGYHQFLGLTVGNFVGKTILVTVLICIMFLCGSVQLSGFCGSLCQFDEPELEPEHAGDDHGGHEPHAHPAAH